MSKVDNGGHAYPTHGGYVTAGGTFVHTYEDGMSLRDYFAAHVTITDNDYETYVKTWADLCGTNGFDPATEIPSREAALARAAFEAKVRYMKADAMIAHRKN